MSNWRLWALALGLMLVVAPFTGSMASGADEDEDDEDDEDVVVLTNSNFNEKIAKAKFALVTAIAAAPCAPAAWPRGFGR
jgi:hypothetical protein